MNKQMVKAFFYWITERQSIYEKKEAGKKWPWTKDPILQEYKFTNPYRQNDRVTKELTKRIKKSDSQETIFKKIIIFRMFNWPETYDLLNDMGLVRKWDTKKATKLLRQYKSYGNKVFTGAYMMTGKTCDGKDGKIIVACESIGKIMDDTRFLLKNIKSLSTLRGAVNLLKDYRLVGGFVAYEWACDMRHNKILAKAKDIYTWANPGPGAKRGMHRVVWGSKDKEYNLDYQHVMRELMKIAQKKINPEIEMRDIEHSLCEFDKYQRVKNDEGRPRSRYKHGGTV